MFKESLPIPEYTSMTKSGEEGREGGTGRKRRGRGKDAQRQRKEKGSSPNSDLILPKISKKIK